MDFSSVGALILMCGFAFGYLVWGLPVYQSQGVLLLNISQKTDFCIARGLDGYAVVNNTEFCYFEYSDSFSGKSLNLVEMVSTPRTDMRLKSDERFCGEILKVKPDCLVVEK